MAKHDWTLLKQQYITWTVEDVRTFLRGLWSGFKVDNWNVDIQTKGRKEARKKHREKILENYEPPLESKIKLKEELDEWIKFLPILIKAFRKWIQEYINKKWTYPWIDTVVKYAKLLENYSWFKLGSDVSISLESPEERKEKWNKKLRDINWNCKNKSKLKSK